MEHISPSNDSLERNNFVQSMVVDTNDLTKATNMNTTSLAEDLLHLEGITDVDSTELKHNSELKMLIDNSLVVTGTVTAPSFTTTSDRRTKINIIPLSLAEYSVDNLNPVKFKFKSYGRRAIETDGIGLIADELQVHYPFLVEGVQDGLYLQSVNYVGLIAVLIKEVQVLKPNVTTLGTLPGRVDTLELLPGRVTTLELLPSRVTTLELLPSRVTTLENTTSTLNTLPDRVTAVENTTSTLNTTVGTLNTTVNTLNTTVNTLNTTVNTLNDRVNSISGIESLDALNTTVNTLDHTVSTLNTTVNTLTQDVSNMATEIENIKINHQILVNLLAQRNLITMEEYLQAIEIGGSKP